MKKFFVFHQYKVCQPNFLILVHLYTYLVLYICVVFRLFCELLRVLSFLLLLIVFQVDFLCFQQMEWKILKVELHLEKILPEIDFPRS